MSDALAKIARSNAMCLRWENNTDGVQFLSQSEWLEVASWIETQTTGLERNGSNGVPEGGHTPSGWRDIKTDPPLEGARVLLLAGDFEFAGFVCDGEAVASGSPFGTTVWDASHWQPLLPPPGEEASEAMQDARRSSIQSLIQKGIERDEEIRALQARYDKLEAAARILLRDPDDHDGENIRWVREFDLNALRSVVDGGE